MSNDDPWREAKKAAEELRVALEKSNQEAAVRQAEHEELKARIAKIEQDQQDRERKRTAERLGLDNDDPTSSA